MTFRWDQKHEEESPFPEPVFELKEDQVQEELDTSMDQKGSHCG